MKTAAFQFPDIALPASGPAGDEGDGDFLSLVFPPGASHFGRLVVLAGKAQPFLKGFHTAFPGICTEAFPEEKHGSALFQAAAGMAKVFLPIPVGYEHMKPHDIQCRIITIIWHMSDHIQMCIRDRSTAFCDPFYYTLLPVTGTSRREYPFLIFLLNPKQAAFLPEKKEPFPG